MIRSYLGVEVIKQSNIIWMTHFLTYLLILQSNKSKHEQTYKNVRMAFFS